MRNSVCSMNKRVILMVCAIAASVALTGGCSSNAPPTEQASVKRAQSKTASRQYAKTNAPDSFDAGAGRPPTAATMYSLSRILAAQERTAECIDLLKNLIQRYPNYPPAYNALAESYMSLDRTDDAIKSLNEGIRRFPKDPVLQNNLGMVHFLSQDYETALAHFDQAVAAAAAEPNYRANKAAALGMLGRTAEAAELYRKHLKQSDVQENVNVLMNARRVWAQEAKASPTTAPAADAPQ